MRTLKLIVGALLLLAATACAVYTEPGYRYHYYSYGPPHYYYYSY